MTIEPKNNSEAVPAQWWMTQMERRVNELHTSIDKLWSDLRDGMKRVDGQQYAITNLDERIRDIRKQVDEVREAIRTEVLTREDFKPFRNGIILAISTIVLAVLTGLLKLVIGPR